MMQCRAYLQSCKTNNYSAGARNYEKFLPENMSRLVSSPNYHRPVIRRCRRLINMFDNEVLSNENVNCFIKNLYTQIISFDGAFIQCKHNKIFEMEIKQSWENCFSFCTISYLECKTL